ncbi:MAG: flagellar hook-associated protein FlgK [Planctomycetes bacterium]|nr:flagellar hook-associated protein FlgK [Planctomycetota bacterium]
MSLISSIQMSANTLKAQQIGLQVVGQNIANANTPGYIREEVIFKPAPTQRVGGLLLGLGVQVQAVIQKIDKFLEERLRGATSDRRSAEIQQETYLQLEGTVGELTDTDLSTGLSKFSATIQDVLSQPESIAARNLAVLQGETLAQDVSRLSQRVTSLRKDINQRIANSAQDINRLVEEIRTLNIQIANTEGGDASPSDAVGLRDQRQLSLTNLAKLINIDVKEQLSGGVNVFVGGDFLVLEGVSREVEASLSSDRGLTIATIQLKITDSPLAISSGEVAGLVAGRDNILGGFLDELDDFARTLTFEFNKIFSSGQGLSGYQTSTSAFAVSSASGALDSVNLPFTPINGSFQVKILNKQTGTTQTTDFFVKLNGLSDDTTLTDLATQLNSLSALSASVSSAGNLTITSNSPEQDFSFANDTSGLLAALGINSFFTGTAAADMAVSSIFRDDPGKFATSDEGIGTGTGNAINMVNLLDGDTKTAGGETITGRYERLVGEVTQGSTVATAVSNGAEVFESTLLGQKLGVSGVSIDEEIVKMMAFQRTYQAAARYIGVISDLLDILVNL